MTQEQKAKAYDEAIKKIKSKLKDFKEIIIDRSDIEEIFPELAESEDEKIRKEIVDFIISTNKYGTNERCEAWLNWLEKQGEQKSTSDIKYEVKASDSLSVNGKPFNYKHATITQKNFTTKVEPKFKVGDWVVCEITGLVCQIKNCIENLSNHKYGYDLTNGGYIGSDEVNHYHLWTIQDAKDGDVLQLGEVTAIFKKFIGNGNCSCYCSVCNGEFEIPSQDGDGNIYGCHNAVPATKEQHDLLFSKMKEAGYEWDKREKRLIKVPKTKEETGVLKQLIDEEKSAWSEEDERAIGIIKIALEHPYDMEGKWDRKFALDWLKSLKDRILPQPKQEWSEEDEYTLGETIQHLKELIRIEKVKHCGIDVQYYQRDIDWLKSLKDRYTWKPSDEQMQLLKELVEDNNQRYFYTLFKSLYDQLKKLREE